MLTRRTSHGLVIPSYGRPVYLAEAIASAQRQLDAFDQIVVVLDGEQDEAYEIARSRGVEVVAIPHAGVAAARNVGIKMCNTDWVSFLDDDDLLHPEYLRRLREFIDRHPDAQAIGTRYWVFSAETVKGIDFQAADYEECVAALEKAVSTRDFSYLDITGRSFDLLLERFRGSMTGATVRRDLLLRAGGFPEGLACGEDWTMFVNVARYTEWHVLAENVIMYRSHPSGNTVTGGSRNGLDTLRAISSFWSEADRPEPEHRPLQAYAYHYRFVLSGTLEACVAERNLRSYLLALRLASPILSRVDRAIAVLPKPIRKAASMIRRRGDNRRWRLSW